MSEQAGMMASKRMVASTLGSLLLAAASVWAQPVWGSYTVEVTRVGSNLYRDRLSGNTLVTKLCLKLPVSESAHLTWKGNVGSQIAFADGAKCDVIDITGSGPFDLEGSNRYQFRSPGAAAAQAITESREKLRAEERQKKQDDLQQRLVEAQIAALKAQSASIAKEASENLQQPQQNRPRTSAEIVEAERAEIRATLNSNGSVGPDYFKGKAFLSVAAFECSVIAPDEPAVLRLFSLGYGAGKEFLTFVFENPERYVQSIKSQVPFIWNTYGGPSPDFILGLVYGALIDVIYEKNWNSDPKLWRLAKQDLYLQKNCLLLAESPPAIP